MRISTCERRSANPARHLRRPDPDGRRQYNAADAVQRARRVHWLRRCQSRSGPRRERLVSFSLPL